MIRPLLRFLAGLAAVAAGAALPRPPNILYVCTDDQHYAALSVVQLEQGAAGRFPWLQTPHLDRLAAGGVRFREAFVVNSLCSPSRAVALTGRYNHLNGVASNFRPFPADQPTFATRLQAAGYTTAHIGKWHMGAQRARPGFDHHASYIAHGRYEDAIFVVDGRDTPTSGWVDDVATDYAIAFIERQRASGRPWLVSLGYKTPHQPWTPPARAHARYAGETPHPAPNAGVPPPYLRATGARAPAPNLDYFRCVSALDDSIGRLLDALDALGQTENTIVIFTSDNGTYLGAHATRDKRSAYEDSLRVPLLVRYPALGPAGRGRTVDAMVLNLDLAPTLLALAGLSADPAHQGRSWLPWLTGQADGWRDSWFYEYFAERQAGTRVPDITAVRTADAKLIYYRGHAEWTELFDLRADPAEVRNLIADPAAAPLKARLAAEHDRLAREIGYTVPAYVDRPPDWDAPGGLAGRPLSAPPR
jgi:arylsulfatase A-like enzyme